jgi:hypothetical protein
MAAQRGTKVTVRFAGQAVDGVPPVEVTVPTDPTATTLWVTPRGPSGLHGWPVALAVSDRPETVEQEPNSEPAKANRLPVPGAVTGRFEQANDKDFFVFTAQKGQALRLDVQTTELHSPTLVYMVIRNAKGEGELAKSNPQAPAAADQRIDFTPPADGDYIVEVQHLNFAGGSEEAYHLTIAPLRPDFDIGVGIDRYDVAPGSLVPLVMLANRRGYAGPIELSVTGPPGLKGGITLPPGQTGGILLVEAANDMKEGPYLITVLARGVIDGTPITEFLNVRKAVSDSLAGLPYPPRQLDTQIAVAVKDRPPFQLASRVEPAKVAPGKPATLIITATRGPGFMEDIALAAPEGLPANVKPPALKPIPKGQSEVKVPLDLNPKAPLGTYLITVAGKAKHQNQEYLTYARPTPVELVVPFSLKVEPANLTYAQGTKAKLKVTASRQGGYQGPIEVVLRNLPAKVTAGKAVIAKGQTTVDIDLAVAPDAPAMARADVNALGTATELGNMQNASPNFTITVAKK